MTVEMTFAILLFYSLAVKLAMANSVEEDLDNANGNESALNRDISATWVLNPPYRGTADILWSCILTLVACVYTAMHLDISIKHRSSSRRVVSKLRWTMLALLAPELIFSWAFYQYFEVRNLRKKLRKIEGRVQTTKSPQQNTRSNYSWWVAMGGFVVDIKDIDDHEENVMVTPSGVKFLAEQGHFLDMPENRIADRSKTNAFAKMLVCIQVLWMLTQCIVRKAAGYPLSLLEIHTMVHVVCALFIYVFWWQVSPLSGHSTTGGLC